MSAFTQSSVQQEWIPNPVGIPVHYRVRVIAWFSLFFQIGIIAMGGIVRLTGSGLGCPTWPLCTEDSWIAPADQGIAGVIETINRMFSAPLLLSAVLALIFVWGYRRTRKDLFIPAILVIVVSLGQGLLGWLTIGTDLNTWVVGSKYLISSGLVALATYFLLRSYSNGLKRHRALPAWMITSSFVTAAVLLITLAIGILTTGSGPHSGDSDVTQRNGLEWDFMTHVHAVPGYVLLALLAVLFLGAYFAKQNKRFQLRVALLIALILVQIAIGIAQARMALPPVLVGFHMVLAAISVSVMVTVIYAAWQEENVAAEETLEG
ncbi:MAG: COX15/CtaA family protein [Microbacteriaceae bacterium]